MCARPDRPGIDCVALPRRGFLAQASAGALLLSPLAGVLAGCRKTDWPQGMAPIRWDRDTCVRCNMVISDRRFAAQLRGGPGDSIFRFDDVGCLVFWLSERTSRHPWMAEPGVSMWVADCTSESREAMRWLDPRRAFYLARTSPMGYNFGAVADVQLGALDFNEMRRDVLARGK